MPSLSTAQTYQVQQPRRQFVSVSLDWLYTQPLHFGEHPIEDLLGTEVASAQMQDTTTRRVTATRASRYRSSRAEVREAG